jgi:hypothetical protein
MNRVRTIALMVALSGLATIGCKQQVSRQPIIQTSGEYLITGFVVSGNAPKNKEKLSDTVVYLKSAMAGRSAEGRVLIRCSHGEMDRQHVCIQHGQEIALSWDDPFVNHVFHTRQWTLSSVDRTNITFACTEVGEGVDIIECSRHRGEYAYITVVPNEHFVMADANGRFSLPKKLPGGRYILRAYHPKLGTCEREVDLSDRLGVIAMSLGQ